LTDVPLDQEPRPRDRRRPGTLRADPTRATPQGRDRGVLRRPEPGRVRARWLRQRPRRGIGPLRRARPRHLLPARERGQQAHGLGDGTLADRARPLVRDRSRHLRRQDLEQLLPVAGLAPLRRRPRQRDPASPGSCTRGRTARRGTGPTRPTPLSGRGGRQTVRHGLPATARVHPRGSALQPKTHFQAHLEMGDLTFIDVASDLGHLEPVEAAQGARCASDTIADRLIDPFLGSTDDLRDAIGVSGHPCPLAWYVSGRADATPRELLPRNPPPPHGPAHPRAVEVTFLCKPWSELEPLTGSP